MLSLKPFEKIRGFLFCSGFSVGPPSAIIETPSKLDQGGADFGFSVGPPSAIIETLPYGLRVRVAVEFQCRPAQCYH